MGKIECIQVEGIAARVTVLEANDDESLQKIMGVVAVILTLIGIVIMIVLGRHGYPKLGLAINAICINTSLVFVLGTMCNIHEKARLIFPNIRQFFLINS